MTRPAGRQPGPTIGPPTRREGSRAGATDRRTPPAEPTREGADTREGHILTAHRHTGSSQGGEEAGGSIAAPYQPAAAAETPQRQTTATSPADVVEYSGGGQPSRGQPGCPRGGPVHPASRMSQPREQDRATRPQVHRGAATPHPSRCPAHTKHTGDQDKTRPAMGAPPPSTRQCLACCQSEDGRGSTRAPRTSPPESEPQRRTLASRERSRTQAERLSARNCLGFTGADPPRGKERGENSRTG